MHTDCKSLSGINNSASPNAAKRILSFDNSNLEFADTQLVAISANTVVILKVAFLKYQFAYKVHDGHITLARQPTGYEPKL